MVMPIEYLCRDAVANCWKRTLAQGEAFSRFGLLPGFAALDMNGESQKANGAVLDQAVKGQGIGRLGE